MFKIFPIMRISRVDSFSVGAKGCVCKPGRAGSLFGSSNTLDKICVRQISICQSWVHWKVVKYLLTTDMDLQIDQ